MSALDRLRDAAGPELVERLTALDALDAELPARRAAALAERPRPPARGDAVDFDVVLAGGGLSLLHAPLLAARGLRVGVFDRARAGVSHREWNASAEELDALCACGLLTPAELAATIVNRYRQGFCRWHGGGTYPVSGALDCAVDAGALLALAREKALAAGVQIFDGHAIVSETGAPEAVRFAGQRAGGGRFEGTARLLLDARGAASPWAAADLTCPTVGGVLTGLPEGRFEDAEPGPGTIDPTVGEILVTTEGVEAGRQHIWEAFPGRPGETAVYLFAYEDAGARRPGDLLRLYARFFERLPRYKRGMWGDVRLIRPTFGHIPGWSRRGRGPRSDHPRIVLLGDAAARHSPLTFCGFGKALRSIGPMVDDVVRALEGPAGRAPDVPRGLGVPDEPLHALTGALAWLMAHPHPAAERAGELNALLDAAFGRLHALGEGPYRALLRDAMAPRDFLRFVRETAALRPEVYGEVFRSLGPGGALAWVGRVLWAAGALTSPGASGTPGPARQPVTA